MTVDFETLRKRHSVLADWHSAVTELLRAAEQLHETGQCVLPPLPPVLTNTSAPPAAVEAAPAVKARATPVVQRAVAVVPKKAPKKAPKKSGPRPGALPAAGTNLRTLYDVLDDTPRLVGAVAALAPTVPPKQASPGLTSLHKRGLISRRDLLVDGRWRAHWTRPGGHDATGASPAAPTAATPKAARAPADAPSPRKGGRGGVRKGSPR